MRQVDVNNAFLNENLTEDVYMTQPPTFEHADKSLVCKLKDTLYDLKQTLYAWYTKLCNSLLG